MLALSMLSSSIFSQISWWHSALDSLDSTFLFCGHPSAADSAENIIGFRPIALANSHVMMRYPTKHPSPAGDSIPCYGGLWRNQARLASDLQEQDNLQRCNDKNAGLLYAKARQIAPAGS